MGKLLKGAFWIFVALVALAILLPGGEETDNGSSDQPTQTSERNTEESLAYQLATIHRDTPAVDKDATIVSRFRYLLEELEQRTQNSRQEIADMSVRAIQLIEEEYGREVELRTFMEEMLDSIPPGETNADYSARAAIMMDELGR